MEAGDGMADRGKHPLDLVLAAFVEGELDAAAAETAGLRRGGRTVVELDHRA
ncbi:MAG TPA: hypothetical protein VIW19_12625 [Gaiellaceae bacterium]